jgi:hypothetical protein
MQLGKDSGIARIFKGEGPEHAGMGIVVDRRHVMTCAHVVNTAVRWPPNGTTRPTFPISVVFPLSRSQKAIDGKVVVWLPMGAGDVAVLELVKDIPEDAGTTIFCDVHRSLADDRLDIFGFTPNNPIGRHVEARFDGKADGIQREIGASQSGVFVEGGFSGAAVWDETHQGVVGMVQSRRDDPNAQVAYIAPTSALREVYSALPVEDRWLFKSFNWVWTAVTSLLLALGLYALVFTQTNSLHPQLGAFYGMHAFMVLGPIVGWLWYLYARDFRLHDWSSRIPRFANVQADPGSGAEKVHAIVSLVFLILVSTYIQGHCLKTFIEKGSVYIYAKRFGFENQLDRKPDPDKVPPEDKITLKIGDASYKCFDRSNILCEHPDAQRFRTVTPRPPAPDSWWDTFWENAYHYGDLGRDPRHGSVTFWPILQPLVVMCLTGLALMIFAIVLLQLFYPPANVSCRPRAPAKG